MTRQPSTTRSARAAEKARLQAVFAAAADERARFNTAIAAGARPVLPTAFGPYAVTGVDANWVYATHPAGQRADSFNSRSFYGCNDGRWADLLAQAGVERHPAFA